ncbi:KUP/HAK/KT family potassium transporter [Hymenobacter weizhouensis]|uniref:KUP/HAK/KT family potassium transporter n=1 Tax=Hymenobacter sp. YIM 151500-1 TaxID=2987689 RepID=UPI002226CEA5|nr:KUP/HAK/KT family potassium transporter [Hymenobacter sp. YIM 151500-1]UYZ64733.1 KUP/HAK/KT family potassium transporter [Hymenobacter sp. YIM 151500-1]
MQQSTPGSSSTLHTRLTAAGTLVALGIVYGDIGTSPLYTVRGVFVKQPVTETVVLGTISCIIWTLTLLTTVKYVLIALRADNHGEGGILALYARLRRLPTRRLYLVAVVGAAALLADGIITPPISVASAIEGLRILKPDLDTVPIVVAILVALFAFQQFGTQIIGRFFGPVMTVFFTMLAVLGITHLVQEPSILRAFSPHYALQMLTQVPGAFWLLGSIFLCSTGAEALYADMGHVGRKNIYGSWTFVKICLLLNYLGQGAWLLRHQGAPLGEKNLFFLLIPEWALLPAIILCTLATIIASQALISGSFTLVIEALRLRFWPKVQVNYPTELRGQAYVPSLNWLLCAGCVGVVLYFRESGNMEAAFGLAVTITMLMTTVLLAYYLMMQRVSWVWIAGLIGLYLVIEGAYLVANLAKFTHGGWLSVLLAGVLLVVMLSWIAGQRIRNELTEFTSLAEYLPLLKELSNDQTVPKYATHLVYLTKSDDPRRVENGIIHSIFKKRPKRADVYYLVHVHTTDDPYTRRYHVTHMLPNELVRIDFYLGFRVDHALNYMFRQVVTDLVQNKEVDITSRYESLRGQDMAGDFQFIILNKTLPYEYLLHGWQRLALRLHGWLKRLGSSETESFGLDNSTYTVENVPLHMPPRPELQLQRD